MSSCLPPFLWEAICDRGIVTMETVQGLMEKMKLSEKEKKGIRVGGGVRIGDRPSEPQAIGKVVADRPVNAEALGTAWEESGV